jgi:hypothetical protein
VIGFGSYLTLLGSIGADRAAFVSVVFPLWRSAFQPCS